MLKLIFIQVVSALAVVAFLTEDLNYSCCLYSVLHLNQFSGDVGRSKENDWFIQPSQGGIICVGDTWQVGIQAILKRAPTASNKLCLWPGDYLDFFFSFFGSFDCKKIVIV